ncbi:MAG: glycerophosphodiester phosphodiesterase [Clostridia bacterium]|nr:glycerophosphodiester phosphodiesterase [Clostridia bacterium]
MIIMVICFILLAILAILCLLYLLILVRPGKKVTPDPILLGNYAHRGLHGNGIPENSLAAFARACEEGFGIELDVQLSRDGTVMVFHDYTLLRMTGRDQKLCELDASELSVLSLAGTDQTIPTLAQVLALVNGRVPLLVELKGEDLNVALCEKVAKLLSDYQGPYCLESFNPLLIRKIKEYLPDAFRGQLYTNVCREKKKRTVLNLALTYMTLNFLAKPDFIAYNKEDRNSLPVRITTRLYHAPKFVWTVKTEEELALAHSLGEYPIFERQFKD